ncbi:hypothetical protein ACJ41O_008851 [Fusarium nematophilum]
MSLELLPIELQCSIIRLLDPIALISISQTATHFRRLINPQKKHFAERLLALETVVEHGGTAPFFRSRDNYLNPNWTTEKWLSIRWACTSCLRLLPHTHFDNHSILRLGYRKPFPTSPVAKALTTWEPAVYAPHSSRKAEWHRRRRRQEAAADADVRQRYFFCVTGGRGVRRARGGGGRGGHRAPPHHLIPTARLRILDAEALSIELERCGGKRWLRKCNECRYMRGELRPRLDGSGGTLKAPIAPSRQMVFGTPLDRYFPRFSEYLDAEQPQFDAPMTRIYRDNARNQLWTMWMVRCPGCATWKELREFRFGGVYQHWKPVIRTSDNESSPSWDDRQITETLVNESRCNACFAKAHGRHELGQVLLSWIICLIDLQLLMLSWKLQGGWKYLHLWCRGQFPKKYGREVKHLAKNTPCLHRGFYYVVNYADVAMLRLRQGQWRDIWERMKLSGDTGWATRDMDEWHEQSVRDFDDCEAHWRWLMDCKLELEEKPDALVEWALSRGAAFT